MNRKELRDQAAHAAVAVITILPIVAFLGLFMVNPEFYLSVAQETMFIVGFIGLLTLYAIGFFWIRKLVNLKV